MDELHGVVGKPYSHPNIRRGMPRPFERASISVGWAAAKRVWKEVRVQDLKAGDVVPDVGRVAEVYESVQSLPAPSFAPPLWTVTVVNVFGETFTYSGEQSVMAFAPDAR